MSFFKRKTVSFLTFMTEKAKEVGLQQCQNCGMDAYFFSISGTCTACESRIPDFNEHSILQYSIEIIREFADRYDEKNSRLEFEPIYVFFDNLIRKLKNNEMPNKSEIIKLQKVFVSGTLGGKEFGGLVTIEQGKLGVTINRDLPDHEELILPLGAVVLAIQNIWELSTGNEE